MTTLRLHTVVFRRSLLHLASKQIPLCSQCPGHSFQHRWRRPGRPSRRSCPVCRPSGSWAVEAWPGKRIAQSERSLAVMRTVCFQQTRPSWGSWSLHLHSKITDINGVNILNNLKILCNYVSLKSLSIWCLSFSFKKEVPKYDKISWSMWPGC